MKTPYGIYYVYTLALSQNGDDVFYVGKGTQSRAEDHILEARKRHLCPRCAVIRYLLKKKKSYWYDVLLETDDEGYAFWYEMKIITSFPYGTLCNLAGGIRSPVRYFVEKRGHQWHGEVWNGDNLLWSHQNTTQQFVIDVLYSFYDTAILDFYLPRIQRSVIL
jgi:hypothetical protein